MRVSPLTFDTMLAEFIIDPSSRNLGLKNLAFVKLGEEMTHIEDLIGKGKKQITMAEVAIESAAPYAVADAEITLRLMPIQQEELKRVNGEKLLYEIDLPLTPVLADMEMTGISLDLPFFQETSKRLEKRLAEIEKASLRGGRQAVQYQLHPTAFRCSLQESRAGTTRSRQQNRQRTFLHVGRCARFIAR